MKTFRLPLGLALLSLLAAAPALADSANPLVDKVRAANDRFKDVAAAVAEGYAPIPCASGLQGGAMGVHYVNGALLKDGVVDIAKPEAVMYEPTADGKMDLVAVEYIAFKGPAALDGHLFNFVTEPNRYGLGQVLRAACLGLAAKPYRCVCRQQSQCELRRHAWRSPLAHPLEQEMLVKTAANFLQARSNFLRTAGRKSPQRLNGDGYARRSASWTTTC